MTSTTSDYNRRRRTILTGLVAGSLLPGCLARDSADGTVPSADSNSTSDVSRTTQETGTTHQTPASEQSPKTRSSTPETTERLTTEGCSERRKQIIDVHPAQLSEAQTNAIRPIEFSNLTSGEKELLSDVVDDGRYEGCPPGPQAFHSFSSRALETIHGQEIAYRSRTDDEPPTFLSAVCYLEYDGELYGLTVRDGDFWISIFKWVES